METYQSQNSPTNSGEEAKNFTLKRKMKYPQMLTFDITSELNSALPKVFESKKEKRKKEQEIGIDDVYKRVGQLEVENDFLKKKYRQFGIEFE